ncbi:unnamed protein product [Adineta steineri]|uniref:Uncharacterized protein n=1 Tax=Adineta steineri TaxID=433720 RepID=A0A816E4E5_9BILA|nr:unnamed protein product [Adineta steineri]CAF1647553.1 unnamed protein product [Adineta steineri]
MYQKTSCFKETSTSYTKKIKVRFNKYSRDSIRLYHGLLATRLYIILFSYSLNEIFNETIINPSGQKYEKLEEKYLSTLTCPCTQISIP